MGNFLGKNSDSFYLAFRVIIGLVFLLYGVQKISAISGGKMALMSLMGLAMLIEVVVGACTILGLFVRPLAAIAALEMAYAFLFVHVASGSIHPLVNKGESALLFFAAFLVLAAFGARRWSFDRKMRR